MEEMNEGPSERELANRRLRGRSGYVNGHSALQSFFYDLLRDHLQPGDVEHLVTGVMLEDRSIEFSNGWLAKYAADLAERLLEKERANLIENGMMAYVLFRRAREQAPTVPEQEHFNNILAMLVKGEFPK